MTAPTKVQLLTSMKHDLVRERQSLHDRGASELELEFNRRRIIETQWQLSLALIEAHAGSKETRAAA